jgi:hypothetical protein
MTKSNTRIATAKPGLFETRTDWQARAMKDLDPEHIEQLRAVLQEGRELPPLSVVTIEDGGLAVVDGYHRYAAYCAEERREIPYVVVGQGEAAVLWQLARANAEHGRSRTSADKREAVKRALDAPEGADASNAAIARWCCVSVDLVRVVREDVRGAPSAAAERAQIISGERAPSLAGPTVPSRTEKRAKKPTNEVPIVGTHDRAEPASRPEPPVTDAAPLPFEPAPAAEPAVDWRAIAEDCDMVARAALTFLRSHSGALDRIPGGQAARKALQDVHAAATRRKPTACPNPACGQGCPVCGGRGWTEGPIAGWERVVSAAGVARG